MTEYSQNGYKVLDSLADTVWYKIVDKTNVYIPLARGASAYVLVHVAKEFNDRVETLNRTDCHGYNRRRISGSGDWSNHASGTAEDLNATKHAYGKSGTFTSAQVSAIRSILNELDGVIRWGGDYRGTKDEMHFEIDRPLNEVKLVAQRLKRNGSVRLKKLKPGARNIDVYMVKRELKKRGYSPGTMNKYFGAGLQKAYSQWQQSLGYTGTDADGIPGRVSLEALGFKVS